jgi:ubiquinone/menaquinone biosynthesis C-methylase UbiE
LAYYGCSAQLFVTDMSNLPIENEELNAVVDVFSSHCLTKEEGNSFLLEINRVLRKGGTFFSYFPSKNSDTWKNEIRSEGDKGVFIDSDTLNGLHRSTSPFYGNFHPFRFLDPRQYKTLLENFGFLVSRCETLDRSYYDQTEVFQFVVIEATKL